MKQLLQDLIWNLRNVEIEPGLSQPEKEAIRKSLVDEYTETVKRMVMEKQQSK